MKPKSLYYQLGFNNIIITLIPLILLGIGFYMVAASSLSKTIIDKNSDIIETLMREMNIMLEDNEDYLRLIHLMDDTANLSSEELDSFLEMIVENKDMIDMVQLLDLHNKIVHMAPRERSLLNTDQSGHSFIKKAGSSDHFIWSQTFLSPQTGIPSVTLTKKYGERIIVLYLNLNILKDLILDSYSHQGAYAFILDRDGTYIAHPLMEKALQRENLRNDPLVMDLIESKEKREGLAVDNEKITLIMSLPRTDWIIGYSQSKKEAFAQILFIRNIAIIGALFTCLLIFLISIIQIRNIAGPISALLDASIEVGRGSYDFPEIPGKTKEFILLTNQFQQMVKSVQNREGELKTLRVYLTDIIDSMPSFLAGLDQDYTITLWNNRAEEFTGIDRVQARGQNILDIREDFKALQEPILGAISKQQIYSQKCMEIIEKGEIHCFDITVYPLMLEDTKGAVLLLNDVTNHMIMEKKIQQQEKLSSIGGMAAGMAHDFNNLLTPILGFSELLLLDTRQDPSLQSYTRQIQEAGEKAQSLIGQLLSFSRQVPQEYKPVDLNVIIEGFMQLLRRTIREDIEIEKELFQEPLLIKGDKGQLEQIIMNLAVNSQFAMTSGGTLSLRTETRFIDAVEESYSDMKSGLYHVLVVEDTGKGMDRETQQHIFDPFYSTKGKEGTGLGLATIYGIVKQHKGHIWFYSEPEMGTTFKISFPAVEEKNLPEKSDSDKQKRIRGGTETILVAEDNAQVRALAIKMLLQSGYKILEASQGNEALEMIRKCKSNEQKIDLLLTDLIMPEMNGRNLYREAIKVLPDIKVVYMSGYSDSILNEDIDKEHSFAFIQKPFSLSTLLGTIRDVLDSQEDLK